MRLNCPYCGEREAEEFTVRGSSAGRRPQGDAHDASEAFHQYVHLRANPAGPNLEHWYHSAGCRSWLLVRRDTRTHEILTVELAAP